MINAILGIDKNYNLKHTHYTAVPVRGATAPLQAIMLKRVIEDLLLFREFGIKTHLSLFSNIQ